MTYSDCMSVALIIQHAMLTRRVIFLRVACLDLPNFSHSLTNDSVFVKKVIEYKRSVLIFTTTFYLNLSSV